MKFPIWCIDSRDIRDSYPAPNLIELARCLEWYDSEDDGDVAERVVIDDDGVPLSIKIDAHNILRLEPNLEELRFDPSALLQSVKQQGTK